MHPIKTALASYGMSGIVFHGPLLETNPDFEIVKILERHANNSQGKHPGAKLVRDYKSILSDDEIELVIVNTPDYLHFNMAKEAIDAGKNVIIEKPFTLKSSEAEELISLAEQNNRMISVFHNRRWDGDFLTVKKIIKEKKLGRLVSFESHFDRFRNFIQESWKEEKKLGAGTLYNLGSHMIDQALQLFGMPEYLFADVRAQRTNSQVDDSFDIFMYYKDVKCLVRGSYLVKEQGPRYILHGTEGSFIKYGIDPQEDDLKAGKMPDTNGWGSDDPALYGILNSSVDDEEIRKNIPTIPGDYNEYYKNIHSHLRMGKELEVKAEEALQVINIIDAAYKSSKEGRVIRL